MKLAGVRVYVASAFQDRLVAKHVAGLLEREGVKITEPWFDLEPTEIDFKNVEACRAAALADIKGVLAADVVVEVCRQTGGRGQWIEMGTALAAQIPVIRVGADGCLPPNRSVFDSLADAVSLLGVEGVDEGLSARLFTLTALRGRRP